MAKRSIRLLATMAGLGLALPLALVACPHPNDPADPGDPTSPTAAAPKGETVEPDAPLPGDGGPAAGEKAPPAPDPVPRDRPGLPPPGPSYQGAPGGDDSPSLFDPEEAGPPPIDPKNAPLRV